MSATFVTPKQSSHTLSMLHIYRATVYTHNSATHIRCCTSPVQLSMHTIQPHTFDAAHLPYNCLATHLQYCTSPVQLSINTIQPHNFDAAHLPCNCLHIQFSQTPSMLHISRATVYKHNSARNLRCCTSPVQLSIHTIQPHTFDAAHLPCSCLYTQLFLQLTAQLCFITPKCFVCKPQTFSGNYKCCQHIKQYIHSWITLRLFQSGISNVLNSGHNSRYQLFGYCIVRSFIVSCVLQFKTTFLTLCIYGR